jgi:hypothetical protein
MDIQNNNGGPYLDGVDISRDQDGDWFATESLDALSLSGEFHGLAGTATGELYAEYTADPQKSRGIARVILPEGTLQTMLTGASLPTARTHLAFASSPAAVGFAASVSAPNVGHMRLRWKAGSAAAGKLTAFVSGRRNV